MIEDLLVEDLTEVSLRRPYYEYTVSPTDRKVDPNRVTPDTIPTGVRPRRQPPAPKLKLNQKVTIKENPKWKIGETQDRLKRLSGAEAVDKKTGEIIGIRDIKLTRQQNPFDKYLRPSQVPSGLPSGLSKAAARIARAAARAVKAAGRYEMPLVPTYYRTKGKPGEPT